MRILIVLLSTSLIAACATGLGYNPRYYFNEVQAVNLSGATISDVSWRVIDTGKHLDCAEVAKFAMCADRFAKRFYPRQGIELSWTDAAGKRWSERSNPHVEAFFSAGFPLRIVLEISADGSVETFYEQDEPGRESLYDLGSL